MFYFSNETFDQKLIRWYNAYSKRSFYRGYRSTISAVITQRGEWKYTIHGVVISLILLLYMSEFFWLYVSQHYAITPAYLQYDLMYLIVVEYGRTEPYQLLTYSGIFFYSFLYNQATYFPRKKFINTYLFYEAMTTELEPSKARYFKDFDQATQMNIKILCMIFEVIMLTLIAGHVLGVVILVPTVLYFLVININPTVGIFMFMLLQIPPIGFAIYHTFRNSFFKLGFSIVMSYVYIFRFDYINNLSSKLNGMRSTRNKCRLIHYILTEHNLLCSYIWRSNPLWCILLAIFVWLNIPINIYWLNQLTNFKMQPSEYVITTLSGITQIIGIYVVIYTVALINKMAHKWRPLFALQISPQHVLPLRSKLKIMGAFEKLASKRKIGVTIGPSSVITVKGCAQFILIYIGYFLMINQFNREN